MCHCAWRTFGSFAILGTLKAARTEALGADVAKVRRGSEVPASLDDKAELDREVTDRKPALLEAMAMTRSRSRSRRGCGGRGGKRKQQDKRMTEEKGITRVWKDLLQTKALISGQRRADRRIFIDLDARQGISPSPSENRGLT